MSRRGNCWDNAPQESYFGHMKDELNLDTCFTFRDVCNEIKDYIEYYNNLEVNQCINLLHHIKKIKLKDNKKPEIDSKIFTSKETDITVQ